MKRISIYLIFILLLSACSKDSITNIGTDANNKFVVNGEGYTNAEFRGYDLDTASQAADSGGRAMVGMTGRTSTLLENFALLLTKKTADVGSAQVNVLEGTTMTIVISKSGSSETYVAKTGTITIDTWGDVGGRSTGKFSGSFVKLPDTLNTVIQITAGVFDSKRIANR